MDANSNILYKFTDNSRDDEGGVKETSIHINKIDTVNDDLG
jgi:hypothetical protein